MKVHSRTSYEDLDSPRTIIFSLIYTIAIRIQVVPTLRSPGIPVRKSTFKRRSLENDISF